MAGSTVSSTTVSYCYVCDVRIDTIRLKGDKELRRESAFIKQFCLDNFIKDTHLDFSPVLCGAEACRKIYTALPATTYEESRVLLKNDVVFDGGSFFDFHSRLHRPEVWVSKDDDYFIAQHHLQGDPSNLEAFLQAWLFFGFASEVLGEFFVPADYICKDDDGNQLVVIGPLTAAIEKWMPSVPRFGDEAERNFARYNRALKIVHQVLMCLQVFPAFSQDQVIFIASAAELIGRALEYIFPSKSFPFLNGLALLRSPSHNAERMKSLGWCPYEALVATSEAYTLMQGDFMARIDRRNIGHRHLDCTMSQCVEFKTPANINSGPKHRPGCLEGQGCSEIRINDDQMDCMKSLLAKQQFALLQVSVDQSFRAKSVDIIPYLPGTQYVAISHVWAQGMGNENDNSLFACQLAHLQNAVEQVWSIENSNSNGQPVLIWIDTLCCPVERRCGETAKNQALNLMRPIYRQATHVLVLDNELQEVDTRKLSPLQVAVHVFFGSSWAWRLWTLQEGVLATEIWVRFEDKLVNVNSLLLAAREIHRRRNIRDRQSALMVMSAILAVVILSERYESLSRSQEVQFLTTSLQKRSVKYQKDEALCIATLLDLDTNAILQHAGHTHRMRQLWRLFSEKELIPRNIAFRFNTLDTLESQGYSWALSTFLRPGVAAVFAASPTYGVNAKLIDKGLLINGSGYMIKPIRAMAGFNKLCMYNVIHRDEKADAPEILEKDADEHHTTNLWAVSVPFEISKGRFGNIWAVDTGYQGADGRMHYNKPTIGEVLQGPEKQFAIIKRHLESNPPWNPDRGFYVLVEIKERNDEYILCRSRCMVRFTAMSAEDSARRFFAKLKANEFTDNTNSFDISARSTDSTKKQTWEAHRRLLEDFHVDSSLPLREDVPQELRGMDIGKLSEQDMVAFRRRDQKYKAEDLDKAKFRLNLLDALAGHVFFAAESFTESQMWCLE